jgi:hypothetical protein
MEQRDHRAWALSYLAVSLVPLWLSACDSSKAGVNTIAGANSTAGRGGVPAVPVGRAGSSALPAVGSTGASGRGPVVPSGVAGSNNMAVGASGQGSVGTPAGSSGSAGTGNAGSAAVAGAPPGGAAGSGAAGMCPHAQMKGTDICTIGDSWLQIPGNQVTTLEDHMKMAGVIPESDHFDRREVSGSTLPSIIGTYNRKPMNCKILVMDGGGIDLFTTAAGNQSAVTPIVQQFKDFLQKLKTDGYVQHIIYSLYPVIPSTPNLNVNMKPGYSEACAASEVDCHLVDLEPLFKGQHFGGDQTHADNAGGIIIGDAWWKAMQVNCIAQ